MVKTQRTTIRTDPADNEYFRDMRDSKGREIFDNLSEGIRFAMKYVRIRGIGDGVVIDPRVVNLAIAEAKKKK